MDTWFNQPADKVRRSKVRQAKAYPHCPLPHWDSSRPIVRCPRVSWQVGQPRRIRGGWVSAPTETKQIQCSVPVGITAPSWSKLILSPRKPSAPKKGGSSAEDLKLATQLTRPVMPIKSSVYKQAKASAIPAERNFRANAQLFGIRAKRVKEAAEQDAKKEK